jgi:hypothetical protein
VSESQSSELSTRFPLALTSALASASVPAVVFIDTSSGHYVSERRPDWRHTSIRGPLRCGREFNWLSMLPACVLPLALCANVCTTMGYSVQRKLAAEKGIFPKRMKIALKRTKSVGKFDKHATLKEEEEESDMTSPHSVKPSHSHESLLLGPQTSLDVFDLTASDLVITPLHSSILGQDHCFQITNSRGKKYYSCRSASERDKWMERFVPKLATPDRPDQKLSRA